MATATRTRMKTAAAVANLWFENLLKYEGRPGLCRCDRQAQVQQSYRVEVSRINPHHFKH